jgi:hypothetical protein
VNLHQYQAGEGYHDQQHRDPGKSRRPVAGVVQFAGGHLVELLCGGKQFGAHQARGLLQIRHAQGQALPVVRPGGLHQTAVDRQPGGDPGDRRGTPTVVGGGRGDDGQRRGGVGEVPLIAVPQGRRFETVGQERTRGGRVGVGQCPVQTLRRHRQFAAARGDSPNQIRALPDTDQRDHTGEQSQHDHGGQDGGEPTGRTTQRCHDPAQRGRRTGLRWSGLRRDGQLASRDSDRRPVRTHP